MFPFLEETIEPLIVEQNNSVHASQYSGTLASLFEKKNTNLKLFMNIVNNLEFQITETDFCLQFRESGSESFLDGK